MQKLLEKTKTWIKNNSGRLLLYAVILTGCFSIKYAAYGKYVDFLKDFTSVVSAPFYFSSNYLGEGGTKKYSIGTFDGQKFQLDIEVRNSDNSYNFNDASKPVYYYVTAELYTDENMTVPYSNTNAYSTIIKYGKGNKNAGGMVKSVKDYYVTEETYWKNHKEHTRTVVHDYSDVIIDMSSPSETQTTHYNYKDNYKLVGFLPGLNATREADGERPAVANVKEHGKQTVSINIDFKVTPPSPLYLKVTAHTLPATSTYNSYEARLTQTDRTTICKIDTSLFSNYPAGFFADDFVAPDVLDNYESEEGIYAVDLDGRFTLYGKSGTDQTQIQKDFSSSATDYTLLCTLKSNTDATARLYYRSSLMTPDDSLTPVYIDSFRGYDRYVSVQLYASGSKSCYFYRKSLDTDVNANDFYADTEAKILKEKSEGQE